MAKLEVKNLMQQYLYGTTGIQSLTFSVEDGNFAVIGGEESGKTSLLRVLSGKEPPYKGEVLLNGEQIENYTRDIVYVRQTGGIFNLRSVRFNLVYPLKLRKLPKQEIEVRVKNALREVGLNHAERKVAGFLSPIEKAKLKLARCFLREAELTLVDEVEKDLNDTERAEILEIKKRIAARAGVKVFACSGYEQAKPLSERGAVLYYGITEQTGKLSEFFDFPETLEVFRLTRGESETEEGIFDSETSTVATRNMSISVHNEYLIQNPPREVIVARAADGTVKIYSAFDEKLVYFD